MRVSSLLTLALLAGCAGCATSLPDSPVAKKPDSLVAKKDDATNGEAGQDVGKSLVELADDIEAHGSSETALSLYRQAVAASGNAPAANVRLGDAYLRVNKTAPAIEAYRAALARDPDNADAQLGLGAALAQQGTPEKGLPALIKAAPRVDTGAAYNRLGVVQTMLGRFADAEASFDKGRAIAPDDLDIATNLALAAALAGETDKAAGLADEIAQSAAAESRHRRNLVIVLGLIGRSGAEARAVAPRELSQRELDALLSRAGSIRGIADPKVRAKALGTMRG
jgi:Flp pilus assembly protein TadD